LAALHADLSETAARLSTVVAHLRGARSGAAAQSGVAQGRLAHAVLAEGCRALDRIAVLPAMARQQARPASVAGADLETQADALASVAARLAAVVRGETAGFRGDLGARSGLAGLGRRETDASLILAAENVSLTLSLAARVVLVLARLRVRRLRARRLATVLGARLAGQAERWVVGVASLPVCIGFARCWLLARTHPVAAVVAVVLVALVLAVLVMSVGGRVRPRLVGPVWAVVDLVADLVGVLASVTLPHGVLLACALAGAIADAVAGVRAARPPRPPDRARGRAVRVGFTSGGPRPRRAHREHRDR
jgi:hypothetical protein